MTKPTIVQRKDIKPEKDITGLETPVKAPEVSVQVIRDDFPKQKLLSSPRSLLIIGDHWNNACCRLLIFWCLITTLSSVISIYYAIGKCFIKIQRCLFCHWNGNDRFMLY